MKTNHKTAKLKSITLLLLIVSSTVALFSQSADILGKQIEASVQNNNPSYLNSLFIRAGFSQLVNNSIDDIGIQDQAKENIIENLLPGDIIQEQLSPGGKYSYLNHRSENGYTILTFRLLTESTIDYHSLFFVNEAGQLQLTDLYFFYNDLLLSQHVSKITRLLTLNNSYTDIMNSQNLLVKKQLKLLQKHKYAKALSNYEKADFAVKSDKTLKLLTLKAASFIDYKYALPIYNSYKAENPWSVGVDLMVLEGLFQQGDYINTLRHIDSLDASLHSDPYLNYLRSSIYKNMNQPDKAAWLLKSFIDDFPAEEIGYFSLLELYLENTSYSKAEVILDKLVYLFGFYKEDLLPILSQFPGYYNSEECATWLANN